MNAIITPEERRLIDEAIARGRVQRVPTGATNQTQYVWNGAQLEAVSGMDGSWRAQRNASYRQSSAKKAPPEAVRKMLADGHTIAEVMTELGCTRHWIIRCTKDSVDRRKSGREIATAKRRAFILAAVKANPERLVNDIITEARNAGHSACQTTMRKEVTEARKEVAQ